MLPGMSLVLPLDKKHSSNLLSGLPLNIRGRTMYDVITKLTGHITFGKRCV